jgi:hypothetical protein
MMDEEHYVYIIATVGDRGILCSPVKVGSSSNPGARLASLKTANPNKIEIVCSFGFPNKEIAVAAERAFHEVLGHRRRVGEWFNMGPTDAVESMCRNVRAMHNQFEDWTPEEREFAYYASGAWDAERKAMTERYLSAWENQ